jgi:hypothetical protein
MLPCIVRQRCLSLLCLLRLPLHVQAFMPAWDRCDACCLAVLCCALENCVIQALLTLLLRCAGAYTVMDRFVCMLFCCLQLRTGEVGHSYASAGVTMLRLIGTFVSLWCNCRRIRGHGSL